MKQLLRLEGRELGVVGDVDYGSRYSSPLGHMLAYWVLP